MAIYLKTQKELDLMRRAGRIVGQTLQLLAEHVKPGVTTAELDDMAYTFITSQGAIPTLKGYAPFRTVAPFPGSICASVNEVIVHERRYGDLVETVACERIEAIDRVVFTEPAPPRAAESAAPLSLPLDPLHTFERFVIGPGNRLGDISHAVELRIGKGGKYGIVREYGGHGIGRSLWEEPSVPNFGPAGKGVLLEPGMVIAIEPMVNMGVDDTRPWKMAGP